MGKPTNLIPMTHIDRVKAGLRAMIKTHRDNIEKTMANGKITADYSLGFVNALIFMEHQISKRPGEPVFYNRTTSVGSLPKPIALNSGDPTKDTTTYQVLMDHVLVKCRQFFNAGNAGLPQEKVMQNMNELEHSIAELDRFVEGDRNGRDEQRNGEVSGGSEQHPITEHL